MTLREITIHLYDASEYAVLIAGILGAFVFFLKGKLGALTTFLIVTGLIRVISIFLAEKIINTMPLYHLLGGLELIFVFFIYRKEGIANWWRYVILIALFLYASNSFLLSSLKDANNWGLSFVQCIILILGFNYLFVLMKEQRVKELSKESFFYINAGFMMYAGSSFFITLLSSEIISKPDENSFFHNSWILEAIFGIIRILFFVYAYILIIRER